MYMEIYADVSSDVMQNCTNLEATSGRYCRSSTELKKLRQSAIGHRHKYSTVQSRLRPATNLWKKITLWNTSIQNKNNKTAISYHCLQLTESLSFHTSRLRTTCTLQSVRYKCVFTCLHFLPFPFLPSFLSSIKMKLDCKFLGTDLSSSVYIASLWLQPIKWYLPLWGLGSTAELLLLSRIFFLMLKENLPSSKVNPLFCIPHCGTTENLSWISSEQPSFRHLNSPIISRDSYLFLIPRHGSLNLSSQDLVSGLLIILRSQSYPKFVWNLLKVWCLTKQNRV